MDEHTPSNMIQSERKQTYQHWFNSPVEDSVGFWKTKQGYVTHGDFVVGFYNDLSSIIKANKYAIKNEKAFKKEIARFVYSLSDEGKDEHLR